MLKKSKREVRYYVGEHILHQEEDDKKETLLMLFGPTCTGVQHPKATKTLEKIMLII